MGFGYFTKTHLIDFERLVILLQALAQPFELTRH
jgi:hypothetical protein